MTEKSPPDETILLTLVRDSLHCGLSVALTVNGCSMAPMLQVGDRVTVAWKARYSLKPGDIVLLDARPQPVLHRVIAIDEAIGEPRCRTKGDRARQDDGYHDASRILGRAICIKRSSKSVDLCSGTICRLQDVMAHLSQLHVDHRLPRIVLPVVQAAQQLVARIAWALHK